MPTGVGGYYVYRNASKVSTITGANNTAHTDTGLAANTPYTYTVSAYDNAGNESAQSSPASAITYASGNTVPVWGTYPLLQSGHNVNGGTRNLNRMPFSSDSPWNMPIKDSATFDPCYIHMIPDAEDFIFLSSDFNYGDIHIPAGTAVMYFYQGYWNGSAVIGIPFVINNFNFVYSGGVWSNMTPAPNSYKVYYNHFGPLPGNLENRTIPEVDTNLSVRWPSNGWVDANPSDGHWQGLQAGSDYLTYEGDYFTRPHYYTTQVDVPPSIPNTNGIIIQGRNPPVQGNIAGMGLYPGSHGASSITGLGGLLREGEMIPEGVTTVNGVSGIGPAKHALAIDIGLYPGRALVDAYWDGAGLSSYSMRNLGPMTQASINQYTTLPYPLAGEFSVRGYGGKYGYSYVPVPEDNNNYHWRPSFSPHAQETSPLPTYLLIGSRIAVPSNLYNTLYASMYTEPGRMFLWTMTYYGGYIVDTTDGTSLAFYATEGPNPLDDWKNTFQNYWSVGTDVVASWTESWLLKSGQISSRAEYFQRVPWAKDPSNPNGPGSWTPWFGQDLDLIFRSCKVLRNDGGPDWVRYQGTSAAGLNLGWGGGTGTPLVQMAPN